MDFKTKFKKNKGITLIALVVTIIVLLILAGISITMLTGQNGILNRAGEAKTTNGIAQGEELIKVSVMDALTRGTGELTDENLRKALSSNLGTEGKDYEIVGSKACGWTITIKENEKDYKISSTGKIGEIEKVEGSSSEWRVEGNAVVEYLGSSNDIVVPNYVDGVKITEIGDGIFQNSEKTGELTISEGIKVIDTEAFFESKFKGKLILPNTIKEIGTRSFGNCSEFTGDLVMPDSIEKIGSYAFMNCTGFNGNLCISNSIDKIEDGTFLQCSGFTGKLEIPDLVKEIGAFAFLGCSNFKGNLTIPDLVNNIGSMAFVNMTFDGTLDLGNGNWAKECHATGIFPYTITKIIMKRENTIIINSGDYFISNLKNLKSVWVSSEIINTINTYSFYGANENAIIYTDAKDNDPNWPENWNLNNLKVIYNTSVEKYQNLTD